MKVSTNPPQHLSNYEVLAHFKALKGDNDHLQSAITSHQTRDQARAKQAILLRTDKRHEAVEEAASVEQLEAENRAARRGLSDDLVWVQNEVIKYLCDETTCPTSRQSAEGVAQLARDLQRHGLVKAEVLQICDLAPRLPVELYCIIEETDARFQPDPAVQLEAIVADVTSTLHDRPTAEFAHLATGTIAQNGGDRGEYNGMEGMEDATMSQEYVHEAEWGAGHEEGVGEEREDIMEQ